MIGAVLAVLVFTVVGIFAYRVWYFASKIRSGETVPLPQYQNEFTASLGRPALSSAIVERTLVETSGNPELGADAASAPKLTIVEFADFGCPYSAREHVAVRRLMAKYGDRVRFIYRDYPIASLHPDAYQASLAAECAREQDRFWPYHDKLYANATALGYEQLLRYADEVGLDARRFTSCLAEQRYKEEVERDMAAAEAFGVRGTPTFFLNGQRIEGAIPEDAFTALIDRILR